MRVGLGRVRVVWARLLREDAVDREAEGDPGRVHLARVDAHDHPALLLPPGQRRHVPGEAWG